MLHKSLLLATAGAALMLSAGMAFADPVTLTFESWRTDDASVWTDTIIPMFEKAHPDIHVVFAPTNPPDYNAALNAKLQGGTAGDIILCRPFDASLALFKAGNLADITNLPGMENFADSTKVAWQTDDGKSTFCLPMASVIHGFIYNKDAFADAGITDVPKTVDDFFADLDKIKAKGNYTPIDLGTHDQWEAATMGYQNIGPNYWKGEEGRKALISGQQKLTDPAWVAPYEQLAKWAPYMGDGYQAQTYSDSQNLFSLGKAAIYPAGSWDIPTFEKANPDLKMGAFPPPVPKAGDKCYISDQLDHAVGINAATKNMDAAKTFVSWLASDDFAAAYANALPGFFALTSHKIEVKDPIAAQFLSWRQDCASTIRSTYQILSRGTPNLENDTWAESANVLNGTDTPQAAGEKLQKGLDSWYKPGQS
jgi:raffinose/stachyose/melibiose transport system substrate-binding protein